MSIKRTKINFVSNSASLSALLEAPSENVKAYVLFAHCFTCGKDVVAASRISRALVSRGFAVFRFDFTGLGGSEGDFSNTNFSSNVNDLVAAADFLREHYEAPKLLIGHSLGGATALKAAHRVPECVGVSTIGAPSNPKHVMKQFSCNIMAIEEEGEAEVELAGRPFTIKKQFINDVSTQNFDDVSQLRRALLIFHSPIDDVVNIREAEKIYQKAMHPKSFISLDDADHLLTKAQDAEYVGASIASWASRFLANLKKAGAATPTRMAG